MTEQAVAELMDREKFRPSACFAVAKIGPRWRWYVWPNWYSANGGEGPRAGGAALTRAEAIDQAEAAARTLYPGEPYAWFLGSKHVQEERKREATLRRAQKQSNGRGTRTVEFVFVLHVPDSDMGYKPPYWAAHRVIKKTAKRVFVEPSAYYYRKLFCTEKPEYLERRREVPLWEVQLIVLDRQELEEKGEIWHHPSREKYHTAEWCERWERERLDHPPDCLRILGLTQPCTREAIQTAFREKCRECHPDMGGDAAAFVELHAAYETALSLVGAI
jgi:hypothetical protein